MILLLLVKVLPLAFLLTGDFHPDLLLGFPAKQEESQREDLYEQQQEQHRRRQQEQRRKQESGEDFLQQLRLGLIPLEGE